MKTIALTIALVVGLAATTEAREITAQELQAFVRYSQTLNEIYRHSTDINGAMADAEIVITAYYNGLGTEAKVRASTEGALDQARVEIDAYAASLSFIGKRNPLPDRKMEAAIQAYEAMLKITTSQLEAQRDNLAILFRLALAGDKEAYQLASADYMRISADMILAENTVLKAGQVSVPQTHPQNGIGEAIHGSNRVMRVVLLLIESDLRGQVPQTSVAFGEIDEALAQAEAGIRRGREATDATMVEADNIPIRNKNDKILKKLLGDVVKAYRRAFDIEEEITESAHTFVGALTAALETANQQNYTRLASEAEAFQRNIAPLYDLRAKEQAERLRLGEAFALHLSRMQQ